MTKELVKEGATSLVEAKRLERQVLDLKGRINENENDFIVKAAMESRKRQVDMLTIKKQLIETKGRIEEVQTKFISDAVGELIQLKEQYSGLEESITALEDKVNRTVVKSPVYGSIKRVHVTTVGGVIKPGMDLIEIVPLDDTLLIEAKVRPSDIAFLHPGQKAVVKLSAYDFSIYGGMEGTLEHISSDTFKYESGVQQGQDYYKILIRTKNNNLGNDKFPIIPGMSAQVEIMTGKKTVLSYLLKPLSKAREKALRER